MNFFLVTIVTVIRIVRGLFVRLSALLLVIRICRFLRPFFDSFSKFFSFLVTSLFKKLALKRSLATTNRLRPTLVSNSNFLACKSCLSLSSFSCMKRMNEKMRKSLNNKRIYTTLINSMYVFPLRIHLFLFILRVKQLVKNTA